MNMNAMLDDLAKRSEKLKDTDDYIGPDGLVWCGKCHTPKQTRVEFMGKTRTPYCLCKCMAEKRDAEDAAWRRQQELDRVRRMRRTGFPDAEMARWTFERDDHQNEHLSTVARKYVDNFSEMRRRGKGLLLFGSVGTGKTFMAACIANALIDQGHPCLVTNFSRLTNTISGMYSGKQEYIDGLDSFELLVIDDLASERDTEYMQETVTSIIDARYRSGKPLIITTNLTTHELQSPNDMRKQRIYSRLFEMCVPVEARGQDRRKQRLKGEYEEMADLLGL